MDAALTWLDLTASDRDKMRQVLDLFEEQGSVDEMGLGTLRDALSDALFLGTSTMQTRLRYALFVPWRYRQLETSSYNTDDVAARAERRARSDPPAATEQRPRRHDRRARRGVLFGARY